MNDNKIAWLLRCAIILVGIFGIAVCAFWWPFSISMTAVGVSADLNLNMLTSQQLIEFWVQLAFYELVSLPCFAILLFAWLVTNRIGKDKFFQLKTSKLINTAALILYIDLFIFLIGNLIFMFMKWNDFVIIYYFLAAIGIAVALCMSVIGYYVKKSAALQEEMDGVI